MPEITETLPEKWARERREVQAKLRAMTRDELEAELFECGVYDELIAEVISRISFRK